MRTHTYRIEETDSRHAYYSVIRVPSRADGPNEPIAENLSKENAELIVAALECEPESADYAVGILRRDYYSDVREVGDDLIARIKSGEIEDEDDLQTAIHEDIDGHQRIIYTFRAKISLLASDNEDAIDDTGAENPTVEQRAYWAMRRDVEEYLAAHDVDLNDPGALREVTDEQIATLRAEAATAGDHAQVLICDLALGTIEINEDTTIESLHVATFLSDKDRRRISEMDPDDYRTACADAIHNR